MDEHLIPLHSMQQLAEAKSIEDNWTGLASKEDRRKRQNRCNQRARRRRKATGTGQNESGGGPLGQERSQALEAPDAIQTPKRSSPTGRLAAPSPIQVQSTSNVFDTPHRMTSMQHEHGPMNTDPHFPLTSDHLLTLVQYNVYRAFISNVITLNLGNLVNPSCKFLVSCPPPSTAPLSLQPTMMQRSIPHSSWIDIFPDHKLRDNMILAQGFYDEQSLFNDLVGEVCGSLATCSKTRDSYTPECTGEQQERRGLIVWSTPWDVNSWEVTPEFLRTWGWMLKGCDELLAASNRWRVQRGEELLHVEDIRSIWN